MRPGSKFLALLAVSVATCIAAAPAQSSLVDHGITYTLFYQTTADPTVDAFRLMITGINGPTDTELGRYGVQSFAFNPPTGFVSAGAPAGFAEMGGGLNSGGCNGNGNFFCFFANTTPIAPVLPVDSSLNFLFTIKTSTTFPAGYDPDFKINWVGTKNNYDLVSKELTPTQGAVALLVPEPATLLLFGIGLLGALGARRKHG